MQTQELPMFPLQMVAFPGERIPLHVFESRYQQLIRDCKEEAINFGIPVYINNTMAYGTEVRLIEVVKQYESGESDIICQGLRVFRLNDFQERLGDKLYAGGSVRFLPNYEDASEEHKETFLTLAYEFYEVLGYHPEIPEEYVINSFTLAHKLGLTLDEEYTLLKMQSETERYEFLIKHLENIIKTVRSVNKAKEVIQLNGHFKNFDPLDYKDYKIGE